LLPRQNIQTKKKGSCALPLLQIFGAGKESRTLDLNLGKVALYQLSYSRARESYFNVFFMSEKSTQNFFAR